MSEERLDIDRAEPFMLRHLVNPDELEIAQLCLFFSTINGQLTSMANSLHFKRCINSPLAFNIAELHIRGEAKGNCQTAQNFIAHLGQLRKN